jgi:hypothetical protein
MLSPALLRPRCRYLVVPLRQKWTSRAFTSRAVFRAELEQDANIHSPDMHKTRISGIEVNDQSISNTPQDGKRGAAGTWMSFLRQLLDTDPSMPLTHDQQGNSLTEELQAQLNDPAALERQTAGLLLEARSYSGLDILSHLGLNLKRWDVVSQIVRIISEPPIRHQNETAILKHGPFSMRSFGSKSISELVDRTGHSTELYQIEFPKEDLIEGSVSKPYPPLTYGWNTAMKTRRKAIGQVWRSLGNMVFTATNSTDVKESQSIMDHVLDILAILHHNDTLPENTYWYSNSIEPTSLSQTPLLSVLSKEIFASILDAEWNLFQGELEEDAKFTSAAQYPLPGFRFSETNNPNGILPYAHSVWLELILWICLKGGWIIDGISILRQIIAFQGVNRWTAKSWHDMTSSKMAVCHIPDRTVSAELVTSYMDGLIRILDAKTLKWNQSGELAIEAFLELEQVLANADLPLTEKNWLGSRIHLHESSMMREDDNTNSARLLLANSIHKQSESHTPSPTTKSDAKPEDLDSNTDISIPSGDLRGVLELWHRTLTTEIDRGTLINVKEALVARRLVQQQISSNEAQSDHSNMPEKLLKALIERIISENEADLGKEMLFLDKYPARPLVQYEAIQSQELAPSLIQYAVKFGDHSLLQSVLKAHSKPKSGPLQSTVLIALCQCSIEYRKWFGLEHTLEALRSSWPMSEWQGLVLASLVREILRLHQASVQTVPTGDIELGAIEADLNRVTAIFKNLIKITIDLPERHHHQTAKRQVQTVLGMLSSISDNWAAFCEPFITLRGSVHLEQAPEIFKIILSGVVETQGWQNARLFWKLWCPSADVTADLKRESQGTVTPISVKSKSILSSDSRDAVELQLFDGRVRRYFPLFKVDHTMVRILQSASPSQLDNRESGSR